mgnify:CR=1 FL=1
MDSNFKQKYLKYKLKYINLKNNQNINIFNQFGGNNDTDASSPGDILKEQQANQARELNDAELNKPKVNQGKGILGTLFNSFLTPVIPTEKQILEEKQSWAYVEPKEPPIEPIKISYTEITQNIINKIYKHKRHPFDEGYELGFLVGYETGVNLDYTPNRKDIPGKISNVDFLNGFILGWSNGFSHGKKYYYTTYIQLNTNNQNFLKYKLYKQNNVEVKNNNINNFNEYYIYIKKKLLD